MQNQQTIREPIAVEGLEPYGGNVVRVRIKPADENTGIIFQTSRGEIKAGIDHASQKRSSITLTNRRVELSIVEHFLATLYSYGIDNAIISVDREPSRSFRTLRKLGLATEAEALPILPNRQKTLCDKIDEVGTEPQPSQRRTRKLQTPLYTKKLQFVPTGGDELEITAITEYPIPGEESHTIAVTPESYRDQVSASRSFIKHLKYVPSFVPEGFSSGVAAMVYPAFGIGHGFSEETFFLPPTTLEEWREKEIYLAETARHTIVDRLGAIALLGERLEGVHVTTKFSGHKNDIETLRRYFKQ